MVGYSKYIVTEKKVSHRERLRKNSNSHRVDVISLIEKQFLRKII